MTRVFVATALLLVGALVWGFRLALGATPWETSSGTLAGSGLVVLAATAVVGMLVAASRWARRLGITVTAVCLAIAVAGPVDAWWWLGLVSSAVALGALAGTVFKGYVRERPSAAGPPGEAVVLGLVLLSAPVVSGLAQPGGITAVDIVSALVIAGAGAWYAKAAPGAPVVVRVLVPLVTVVAAVSAGWPSGIAIGLLGAVASWLAWTSGARLAVEPLVEPGTLVRMPAELTPPEILRAAGLDERGRPQEEE